MRVDYSKESETMEEKEVEVGEHVRTKDGLIAKVLSDDGFF